MSNFQISGKHDTIECVRKLVHGSLLIGIILVINFLNGPVNSLSHPVFQAEQPVETRFDSTSSQLYVFSPFEPGKIWVEESNDGRSLFRNRSLCKVARVADSITSLVNIHDVESESAHL
ncbi:MAG: hypothetical protein R2778_07435 [Saprospiraceae bacterium]